MRLMERMRLLGPIVGRLENELLGPLITRVVGILHREGVLPEAPEPIQDKEYNVEFVSPIAIAQKQEEMQGLVTALQPLQMLGEELASMILQRKINPDRLVDHLWDLNHLDPDLLNTEEEIAAKDQQNQMMMASQAMQGIGQPAADMASKMAGATKQLSDAQASGGIDLNQVVQGATAASKMPQFRQMMEQAQQNGGLPQ
jgi:hypothetical protein